MTREVYDRIYFTENYSREMRERNDARVSANQRANAVDMPNATTVCFMEDTPDGGVTITTGDFVAYFNQKCGGDRVGNMRRTLAMAQRNCDLKRAKAAAERDEVATKQKRNKVARPVSHKLRPRFSLVKAVFGLMLLLAVGILSLTSAMLTQTQTEIAALESEVATLQEEADATVRLQMNASSDNGEIDPSLFAMQEKNSVEIHPSQEKTLEMSDLWNAVSSLWK